MVHLVFWGFLLLCAWVFARVEIQVEGGEGWAGNLPTWRCDWLWVRRLLSGRPLTGYHFYVFLFMFLILHAPYGLGLVRTGLPVELRILSFNAFFWITEDFLWFVLNPASAFGLQRFRPECIWWHGPTWWWIMPRDYWMWGSFGIVFYILTYWI